MGSASTAEQRARKRTKERIDVMWHIAAFVVINPFLWAIDIATGDGVNWAFWPTLGWAVGLAFHIATYVIDDGGMSERTYQKFLAEERAWERAEGRSTESADRA